MREPLCVVSMVSVLCILTAGDAWAAAANRIYVGDKALDVGQTGATVPVLVDTDQVRHGFSVAIQYDKTKISVKDVQNGDALTALGLVTQQTWIFGQIDETVGRLHWGVVLDITDPIEKTLPIGTNQEVLKLIVDVVATEAGTTPVTPKDGLNTGAEPPGGWTNILSYRGDSPTHPELAAGTITINAAPTGNSFKRGNCNGDSLYDLSDAIFLLGHLFLGGDTPPCREACNADASTTLDLTDAIFVLGNLFLGGPPPRDPFPACEQTSVEVGEGTFGCVTDTCQ